MNIPQDAVERNLRGTELEKQGSEDAAIECYEANVRDGFEGTHPYQRLAIIWRRQKQFDREAAVLERAIEVFSKLPHGESQTQEFRDRLAKSKALASGQPLPRSRAKSVSRPASYTESGERMCSTPGCKKITSSRARQYCDECREIRAAPNVLRPGDHRPEKLFFAVAGTHHHSRAAQSVVEGEALDLVRDPTNVYDTNAIEVRRSNGDVVGFVPRDGQLQGRWGYGPYTQVDLAKAMDAGARVSIRCYAAGGRVPGSVQVEGHCDGWMQPFPARLDVWAARGTQRSQPPEPLPPSVRDTPDAPQASSDALLTGPAVIEPVSPISPPLATDPPSVDADPSPPEGPPARSWWRKLLGVS